MTERPALSCETPVVRLEDLEQVAGHLLRLLRLWSWGDVHHATLRLALPLQFGVAGANCLLSALAELSRRLRAADGHRFDVRPPDTARLSPDEVELARFLIPQGADRDDAAARVVGRLGAENAQAAAVAAEAMARVLRHAAAGPQTPARPVACPVACPARSDCPERPTLRLVT